MEQSDRSFAELAVKQGIASREQVDECTEAVRKAAEFGAVASLPDTMVNKGYISRKQADTLLAKIRSADSKVTSIGGYELIETLGRGAMGVVYKARQVSIDRIVAIKLLKRSLSRSEVFVERFFREARTAAKLNDPNIVQAIDAGFDQGYHYFVMEFVDGPTAGERLKDGPLDESEALKITRDVAQALAHAQLNGIVHRDIKPGNIMLTGDGRAKLADLGLAKNFEADSSLTVAGKALGTPYYMSPEQARGEANLDTRSDIYSLGATLYHLVTGSVPFEGETPAIVLSKRLSEPAPSPRDRRPELSLAANRLIRRMMAKDPDRRYQTAEDLVADVEAAMRGEMLRADSRTGEHAPVRVGRERAARKSSKAGLLIGCGVAVAAVIVVILLANRGQGPGPPPVSPAEKALAAAMSYSREHPSDLDGAIQRLEAVAARYKGTTPAEEAEREAQALRRRKAGRAVATRIDALRQECKKLAERAKYGGAIARAEAFAKGETSDLARQEAAKLKTEILARAEQHYADLVRAADAAVAKGDYRSARNALAPVKGFGLAKLEEKMKGKLAQIDSREKNAEQWAKWEDLKARAVALTDAGKYEEAIKLLETAEDLTLPEITKLVGEQVSAVNEARQQARTLAAQKYAAAFAERVRPLLTQRSYAKAKEALEKVAARDDLKLAAEQFENGRKDIARLIAFWRHVEGKAAELTPGQNIRIGGKLVQFVSFKAGLIRYKVGAAASGVRLLKMKGTELFVPAALPANDELRFGAALFLLYDKDADPARALEVLAKVEEGPDVERYREMVGAAGRHDIDTDEKAAQEAFPRLLKQAAPKPAQIRKLLADYRAKHGHTRFFNERLADMALLRAAQSAIDKLTSWRGSYYLLLKEKVSWHDARKRCQKLGGHLVTITSADEQAFMVTEFLKPDKAGKRPHMWIGATDDGHEGKWEWITGEKWSYSVWLPGEPSGGRVKHWAVLSDTGTGNIGWNDRAHWAKREFLCEWEKDSLHLTLDNIRELGLDLPADGTADYEKRLAKRVSYRRQMAPLQYATVGILNQVDIPYQWDKSAAGIGADLAAGPIDVDVRNVPARAALKRILDPLALTYDIEDDGLVLRSAKAKPASRWKKLFDGKTLRGWKVVAKLPGRGAPGAVRVEGGSIILEQGAPSTGIVCTRGLPTVDYELAMDAMRVSGYKFYGATFPVGKSHCSFFIGGVDGTRFGLERIDGKIYWKNETKGRMKVASEQWYRVRLRVTKPRIELWIDDDKIVDFATAGHSLTPASYHGPLKPFGLCSEAATVALRNIAVRRIEPRRDQGISEEALKEKVHGKIIKWNPKTLEITLAYDFDTPEQLFDWPGGTLDEKGRLRVNHSDNVVMGTQFSSIKRVDYEGYFIAGGRRVTLRLKGNLMAELGGYGNIHLLYQGNWRKPVIQASAAGFKQGSLLKASMEFAGGNVRWVLNGKVLGSTRLQKELTYPIRVGFGHAMSDTRYDNVRIVGTIDRTWLEAREEEK